MLPPPNEDNRIAELMRRVDNLESALRAAFTTISGGRGLRVNGGGGITIEDGGQFRAEYPDDLSPTGPMAYVGKIINSDTGVYLGTGWLLQAPDGTDMMVVRTEADTGTTLVNLYDSGGRIFVGNDAVSGQGMARPNIPFPAYTSRSSDWPVTTSGTFTTIYRAKGPKHQPRLYVETWANCTDAAATAEVRVMVNGVQLGSTGSSTPGFVTGINFGPAVVAGNHMTTLSIEVQYRLASGIGNVQCGLARIEGWQS